MPMLGDAQISLDRSANQAGRVTIAATDDTQMWQEVTHKGAMGEMADGIELTHPYGFTSNVQPPSAAGSAEGVALYLGGDRSHGVIIAHGDRRFRPTNLAPGESTTHDDQGQKMHHQRGGTRIASPSKAVSTVVDAQSQTQVIAGGYVLSTVGDITKFKIFFGGQWWQLSPSALVPSSAPPTDPTHA